MVPSYVYGRAACETAPRKKNGADWTRTTTHNEGVCTFSEDEQPATGMHPFRTVIPLHHGDTKDFWRAVCKFCQPGDRRASAM